MASNDNDCNLISNLDVGEDKRLTRNMDWMTPIILDSGQTTSRWYSGFSSTVPQRIISNMWAVCYASTHSANDGKFHTMELFTADCDLARFFERARQDTGRTSVYFRLRVNIGRLVEIRVWHLMIDGLRRKSLRRHVEKRAKAGTAIVFRCRQIGVLVKGQLRQNVYTEV